MKFITWLAAGFLMSNSAYPLHLIHIEQLEHQQVLKTPAKPVQFPLSADDKQLIAAMKEKLHALEGVGLAAPQVNQSRRIIAVYIPESAALLRDQVKPYPMHIMINPSYEGVAGLPLQADFEACYSVADKAGKVPRFQQITVTYYDEDGEFHRQQESGFYARVLQHEIDHLNGVLIIDRLTPDCVQGSPDDMRALRRAELPEAKRQLFDDLMSKKAKK
ncbi:peptide deformylase [Legionella taurinensis]|uniref:Peptide deformylase n=2 Tax=Legionella taurinensis TaxID=70611 RepID=A0AB38N337_9GAMM|nr:peptide deformylase [Legionella taurinensis]MDX1837843.1 peptide deformylase [Legionella taurinensis]PUT39655.1 peptide deformylase [Legionella taurinensis]PUT43348.1 peptide deformylase [Legionella taurinensis]PUT45793.1 peptide deformylase [Legionella taurinensis]PUT47706.1 peptide deformylase [Legionella taurinensis]